MQRQRYKRIPFSSASGSQDSDRHVKTCHVHAVKSAGGRLGSHGWQGLLGKVAGGCWQRSGRVGGRVGGACLHKPAVAGPPSMILSGC